MIFLIASSIIGLAASAITIKTLIGYTSLKWWWKLIVALIVLFCWFGHNFVWCCRHHNILSPVYYNIFATAAYIGLGVGFILLVLLLARDFIWFASYEISKLAKLNVSTKLDPMNLHILNIANLVTIGLALILTGWGMYEALKTPEIKTITISDAKIKKPFKLVQINDLHINRLTSEARVQKLVDRVNALDADAIAIVGDIADEIPSKIEPQINILKTLKAKHGLHTVFGNHDFYMGLIPWLKVFTKQGFGPLFNSGRDIDNNIYIAGIPDKSIDMVGVFGKIDMSKALKDNNDKKYTVLLSHTPDFTEEPIEGVDLILSGHTHGGQIFPFHFLVKSANKYLAGLYQEDGYKIYVSRGTGFWGPPIRLFAPSEITVINLEPEK